MQILEKLDLSDVALLLTNPVHFEFSIQLRVQIQTIVIKRKQELDFHKIIISHHLNTS